MQTNTKTPSPNQQILIKGYEKGLFDKLGDISTCKQLGAENNINPFTLLEVWKDLEPLISLICTRKAKKVYISYAIRIEKPLLDELQSRNREGGEKMITMINSAISDYLEKKNKRFGLYQRGSRINGGVPIHNAPPKI